MADHVTMTMVDGVAVFHAEGPAPFSAGVVFGVGRRDETFAKGGLSHLVEHLTMREIGRTSLESNAAVHADVTEFTAIGRPERVSEFLCRVCEVLSELPTDSLRVEADVLRAEGALVTHPFVGALCATIYGGSGLGLTGYREPALGSLTAADVRAWAGRYFTRANAAVWIAGPLPADLALSLPAGERPARAPQRTLGLSTPAWTPTPGDGFVGFAAHVPRTAALNATVRILRGRVEDELRHRRGLSYAVGADQMLADRDHRLVFVVADVRDGEGATAMRALWTALHGLADAGPTEEELDHDRAGLAEYLEGPGAAADEVRCAAITHVTEAPPLTGADLRAESDATSAAEVRAVAEALRWSAVLGLPGAVEPSLPGVTRVPEWSADAVTGTVHRRRMRSSAPRGARLVLGEDGVSLHLGDDRWLTVRYAETIGLIEQGPGEYQLVGGDGFSVSICGRDWRGGAAVVDAVRAAVPAELQVRADPEDGDALPGPAVILLHAGERRSRDALWPASGDLWFLPGDQWCVVVPTARGIAHLLKAASDISAMLGRNRAVLVLARGHNEVSYRRFRKGREVDQHVWAATTDWGGERASDGGGEPGELARVLRRPDLAPALSELFSTRAEPAAVIDEVVRTLGLPDEVRRLLDGQRPGEVGLEMVPARTFAASMLAEARDALLPGRKERSRGFHVANVVTAALLGVFAWWAGSRAGGDWISWWGLPAALAGGGAAYGLWFALVSAMRSFRYWLRSS
jgi:predicted Zn-dependent peptidase